MKKILLTLISALAFSAGAFASEEGPAWDKAPNNINDLAALQNGAKLFVNYCLSCHSAAFMRFNRMRDIGLTEQQIKDNLLFTTEKVGDTMKAAIDPKQAKEWFGANPPDLTLVARSRSGHGGSGADYLYTYLRTFYRDQADRLEQPGVSERGHATCAVAAARRTRTRVRNARRTRPRNEGVQGLEAGHARHHDAAPVRGGRGRLGRLSHVDVRAGAECARAGGRVGAAVPGPVHGNYLALERGVLERN
jgi:hypothetical protein